MAAREVLRRILLWGIVAVFFAASITLAVLGEWTALLGFAAFPIVGAVILTSRPGNAVGWYLLGVGIASSAVMWAGLDAELLILVPPSAEWAVSAAGGVFWTSLFVVGVIYPTGRAETKLGRFALWASAVLAAWLLLAAVLNSEPLIGTGRPTPFGVQGAELFIGFSGSHTFALIALVVTIVVDLVVRWRRASPIAALQYRWFVFGLVGALALGTVGGIAVAIAPGPVANLLNDVVATIPLNLIPLSIGIAITRHGLFEIDRIVSRTVAYAAVTLLLVGVYAAVVTSATMLAPGLPSAGVALATLAAAALFLPALRGIQRVVDRRFDRERYNAHKVVESFGAELRAQLDPAATAPDLTRAVEKSLQPTSVGLWIREAE